MGLSIQIMLTQPEVSDLEQEAQTALLSIGAVLEWLPMPPGCEPLGGLVWETARFDTNPGHQSYKVEFGPNYSPLVKAIAAFWDYKQADEKRTLPGGRYMTLEHWYPSVAEAKAACEVHAATGAFPPGVEPPPAASRLVGP